MSESLAAIKTSNMGLPAGNNKLYFLVKKNCVKVGPFFIFFFQIWETWQKKKKFYFNKLDLKQLLGVAFFEATALRGSKFFKYKFNGSPAFEKMFNIANTSVTYQYSKNI